MWIAIFFLVVSVCVNVCLVLYLRWLSDKLGFTTTHLMGMREKVREFEIRMSHLMKNEMFNHWAHKEVIKNIVATIEDVKEYLNGYNDLIESLNDYGLIIVEDEIEIEDEELEIMEELRNNGKKEEGS